MTERNICPKLMGMSGDKTKVFDILGHEVKLSVDQGEGHTPPEEIVDYVRKVAGKIKNRSLGLDNGQVFLLAALKIAEQRLELSHEYKENVNLLQSSLVEARELIDQAAPAG